MWVNITDSTSVTLMNVLVDSAALFRSVLFVVFFYTTGNINVFGFLFDVFTQKYEIKTCFCPTLGEIPDAAFIHAARKRRQLAREQGGEAPLVETETPKKRLVREDQDVSDDEDEEEKRIRFSGVRNKSQRQKIAEEIGTLQT